MSIVGHPKYYQSKLPNAIPLELDRITDAVLAYTPKPKTKAQKKRARKKAKRA